MYPGGSAGRFGIGVQYRGEDAGERARDEYVLTEAGRELNLVLCALQQWGDRHVPSDVPTIQFSNETGLAVRVEFVDPQGEVVATDAVEARRPGTSGPS